MLILLKLNETCGDMKSTRPVTSTSTLGDLSHRTLIQSKYASSVCASRVHSSTVYHGTCTVRNKSPPLEITHPNRLLFFSFERWIVRKTTAGSILSPSFGLSLHSSTHVVLLHMSSELELH